MTINSNQSTNQFNSNDWHKIKAGLINTIEQYLTEKRKGQVCDDTITGAVLYFLGSWYYPDNLYDYKMASVSALRTFASNDVATILTQKMGEYYYDNLCKMLEGIVRLCCTINCDIFRAELDYINWSLANLSDASIDSIKNEKEQYERKLKNYQEDKMKSS